MKLSDTASKDKKNAYKRFDGRLKYYFLGKEKRPSLGAQQRNISRVLTVLAVGLSMTVATQQTQAAPCYIHNISPALTEAAGTQAIVTTKRLDPDSSEPIIRSIIDYPTGSTIIVEQSSCQMENISIAILSTETAPSDRDLQEAGRLLGATQIWMRNYPDKKATDVFRAEVNSEQFRDAKPANDFFYGVDQRLDTKHSATEAIVTFFRTDSPGVTYRSQMSIYIGIGGK